MILVTGATGTVGRAVAATLARHGVAAAGLSRDPNAPMPSGLPVIAADLGVPSTLDRALRGVESVFLMAPGHHKQRHDANLIAAARGGGVRRIVQLSSSGVTEAAATGQDNALARWHREAEDALRGCGLEWTILRPGEFMSNALAWAASISTDRVAVTPAPELVQAPIDPDDIAAVAVEALTEPGHDKKIYELTGPEQLSAHDQIGILGEVLGHRIRVETISLEQHRKAMLLRHPPETVAGVVEALGQALARSGKERAKCVPTVGALLTRPARSFRQWALEKAPLFSAKARKGADR